MMDIDKITSMASRLFFGIALLTLAVAVLEKAVNVLGYTFLKFYSPERLLDISVTFAMFILVLLARQIRQDVRARNLGA
ncbi:hypothetical protein DRQ50_13435 [bacterium]|nr:MAG: hypothetical protein DRQ50_13435 [bacterium]